MSSRRDFVTKVASAAALAAASMGTHPRLLAALEKYPRAGDPRLKELAAAALDAARAAGATYADVRFTLTRTEQIFMGNPDAPSNWATPVNELHAAAGVRVLADGAWGFAASNVWSTDEAALLGRGAALQAKTNARGRRQRIELGAPPPAVTGEWVMPVRIDPFTLPWAEKLELMSAINNAIMRVDVSVPLQPPMMLVRHRRQEKTFSSTDGSFITQTLYFVHPYLSIYAFDRGRYASRTCDRLQPAAAGWEVVADPSIFGALPQLVEEVVMMLEGEPIDPDRHDIVLDGFTVARLLGGTVGLAGELDRVLGYEANAGGTSYLAPPEKILGQFALGPAKLNVVANRSRPGAAATVKWDDEGRVPDEYTVIKDGVVVDYHTTREMAMALNGLPGSQGRHRSHGCAASDTAMSTSMLHAPNLAMVPAADATRFEDLVSGLERGLVVVGGTAYPQSGSAVSLDRQQLNGEINGSLVYEVRNGKRTRFIRNSEVLFRAPELWKGLQAIGGQGSQVWTAVTSWKGQPRQAHNFGVGGVPARFTRVPVTDRSRRA